MDGAWLALGAAGVLGLAGAARRAVADPAPPRPGRLYTWAFHVERFVEGYHYDPHASLPSMKDIAAKITTPQGWEDRQEGGLEVAFRFYDVRPTRRLPPIEGFLALVYDPARHHGKLSATDKARLLAYHILEERIKDLGPTVAPQFNYDLSLMPRLFGEEDVP